jgi:hypothetical protein
MIEAFVWYKITPPVNKIQDACNGDLTHFSLQVVPKTHTHTHKHIHTHNTNLFFHLRLSYV